MAREISGILKKAPAMPAEARVAMAGSLLESLDEFPLDSGVEAAWSEEIARRVEELDSGKVKPVPWAEARRQISDLLNGRSITRDPSGGIG
jgi:putative addiction module component (TIGR02574 family)